MTLLRKLSAPGMILVLMWGLLVGEAQGCLWINGTTIDGLRAQNEGRSGVYILESSMKAKAADQVDLEYIYVYLPDDPIASLSDEAVKVLLRGDAKQAVAMLERIEEENPGAYFTAANLGTSYELAGDDEAALRWILEGIKRNPESHMFTEWLHARILETKIQLKKDANWLTKNTITQVDFGRLRERGYELATRQKPVHGRDLAKALVAQLSVRMLFVKPQDVIVAQLLYELAQVEAQVGFLEDALRYAEMAKIYGFPSERLAPMTKKWERTVWWAEMNEKAKPWLIVLVISCVVIFGVRYFKLKLQG